MIIIKDDDNKVFFGRCLIFLQGVFKISNFLKVFILIFVFFQRFFTEKIGKRYLKCFKIFLNYKLFFKSILDIFLFFKGILFF